ncbi:MAG: antitoxin [Ancrocorticia sp.]
MSAITVRNLSPETHRALKARALEHGRSTEAEVRAILDEAVAHNAPEGIGSLLARVGRDAGIELEIERHHTSRNLPDFS